MTDAKEAPVESRGCLTEDSAEYKRMLANVAMHTRWEQKYALRHPYMPGRHGGMNVWAGLRMARLRWSWRGGGTTGWQWAFADYWGLKPRFVPLREAIRRSGFTESAVVAKLLELDEGGILPREFPVKCGPKQPRRR